MQFTATGLLTYQPAIYVRRACAVDSSEVSTGCIGGGPGPVSLNLLNLQAGDYYVYEIAHLSYLVVRQSDGTVAAHQNVCLHRGRLLKDASGKGEKEFRCSYHGWAWNLDGSLKHITNERGCKGRRRVI